MRVSNQLVFASNNPDKFEELAELLKPYPGVQLLLAGDVIRNSGKLGLVEVHSTYEENALAKARAANSAAHYPCLGDDSGLEVEVLGGKPGHRSARYAIAKAGESQDEANIQKLLKELMGFPMEKRKARFVCCLALVLEGVALTATGVLEGMIAEAPMGDGGFGYDPVFIPKGFDRSVAQLPPGEKNRISHRARALEGLMAQVQARGIVFARP